MFSISKPSFILHQDKTETFKKFRGKNETEGGGKDGRERVREQGFQNVHSFRGRTLIWDVEE